MSQVAELLKAASKWEAHGSHGSNGVVSSLLEDLDACVHHVSDLEAMHRLEELKTGAVGGLSEVEFWKTRGRE